MLNHRVDSMEDLWAKVTEALKERVGQLNFDIWIKPIQFISAEGGKVELEVPNRFFKEWITEHYSLHIKDVVSLLTQMSCQLQFRIRSEKADGKDPIPQPSSSYEQQLFQSFQPHFNPKYTFDHFVVGASNQFAHAACLAVADLPAKNYNPLFIYGGVGLGKTHLLHAIGNHIVQHRILPDVRKICYISSEEFTNELINSLRYEKMDQIRTK